MTEDRYHEISRTMDLAFVKCRDLPFDDLQKRLASEVDTLLRLWEGDPLAWLEAERCRYERLLMGAIHRKRSPDDCAALFNTLEHLTFSNIHRKWLVLQNPLLYLLDDETHQSQQLARSLAISMHRESMDSLQQLIFALDQNIQLMCKDPAKP